MALDVVKIRKICEDKDLMLKCLQDWGLILKEPDYLCPKCSTPMRLTRDSVAIDGYGWHCRGKIKRNKQKAKKCYHSVRLRKNTIFARSHLQLWQILVFIKLWVDNIPLNEIGKQISVLNGFHTLVNWASFCRDIIYNKVFLNREKIGGPGKTVEINESMCDKRKHSKAHCVDCKWIVGGIENESGRFFIAPVEERSESTLVSIIKNWIIPGTPDNRCTIISDYWEPHIDVEENVNYKDLKISHCFHFIYTKGDSAICPEYNIKKSVSPSYLTKYIWLCSCKFQNLDPCLEFYNIAGSLYNPNTAQDEEGIADTVAIKEEECNELDANKKDQQAVVTFLSMEGLEPKEIYEKMLAVYGASCYSQTEIADWCRKIREENLI